MRSMKGRRYDGRDIKVAYVNIDVFNNELKPVEILAVTSSEMEVEVGIIEKTNGIEENVIDKEIKMEIDSETEKENERIKQREREFNMPC